MSNSNDSISTIKPVERITTIENVKALRLERKIKRKEAKNDPKYIDGLINHKIRVNEEKKRIKAIYDEKLRQSQINVYDFTETEQRKQNFTMDYPCYFKYLHFLNTGNQEGAIFPNKADFFPRDFLSVSFPEIFNFTHWIGFDLSFDNKINSSLKIFKIDNPTVLEIKINIWRNKSLCADDYWFCYEIRPERIYLTDYDGFKIFDFELNLLEFRPISQAIESNDVYFFEVNSDDPNSVWVWSYNEAKQILGPDKSARDRVPEIGSVCEYIQTKIDYFLK